MIRAYDMWIAALRADLLGRQSERKKSGPNQKSVDQKLFTLEIVEIRESRPGKDYCNIAMNLSIYYINKRRLK